MAVDGAGRMEQCWEGVHWTFWRGRVRTLGARWAALVAGAGGGADLRGALLEDILGGPFDLFVCCFPLCQYSSEVMSGLRRVKLRGASVKVELRRQRYFLFFMLIKRKLKGGESTPTPKVEAGGAGMPFSRTSVLLPRVKGSQLALALEIEMWLD